MSKKLTNQEFIQKSKEIHDNKYDYSLVNYINNRIKVKIICKKHGVFEQEPKSHLNQKQGCPKCSKNYKLTTNTFIKKAKEIHNDKYDYSLVNYINTKTKVKIICKKHGIFEQIPDNHIHKKYGCPICNNSKGELKIIKYLENNKIQFETQKTFNGLKYKQSLYYDFYLSDYNICIEFDGEQHFTKYRFEKDDKKLKIRQLRDQIKNNFCKNNDIKLIRIKYNENIEKSLNKYMFLV